VGEINTSNIQFHSCFQTSFAPHWAMKAHSHAEFHELYLILAGSIETHVEGDSAGGNAGDIMLHPRTRTHFWENTSGDELKILHVRFIGGEDFLRDWPIGPIPDRQGHVRGTLEWMLDLHPREDEFSRPTLNALMLALLWEVNRLVHSHGSELVENTRRFIRENLNRSLSIEDLARAGNLSKFYFIRRFKAAAGMTPKRFLNEMRVEAAEHLLGKTDMTLEAISQSVGFSDASYMSHVFQRIKGRPPGALRKKNGKS
jgi:AraC-like DNA-binding protein